MNYNRKGIVKQLKFGRTSMGYHTVALLRNGKQRSYYRHRLLAEHFIPNPRSLGEINHKNGNREDDTLENLEWCTHSENVKHGYDHLGHSAPSGEKASNSRKSRKLKPEQVLDIKQSKGFLTQRELAEKYKVSKSAIGLIHCGRNWTWLT